MRGMKTPFLLIALVATVSVVAAQQGSQPRPAPVRRAPAAAPAAPAAVDVTVREGTSMSVAMSPDGRTIAADMQGSIWLMPAAGGPMKRITDVFNDARQPMWAPDGRTIVFFAYRDGGYDIWAINPDGTNQRKLTWGAYDDREPIFSHDGTRIAFSSDRGGLWNIWTSDLKGGDLKQVSKEQRWFINSPTWSPDGRFIYARRHFVAQRSLGAGEVWMYHASGSDGLQVTEKVSFQKDQGEPAISPDGRYLYYSKDVTPGQNFEYNKDPHGVIYAIIRRDLTTGQERTLTARPGGAITPRPSPDGKHLAFIRRVDLKSHLFLRDLKTGDEWSIFDRLDKDLQEAWAVLGVYAQYAWSPDNRFIYIWGEGKIWKVDVAKKAGAQVPFTARVEQTLALSKLRR